MPGNTLASRTINLNFVNLLACIVTRFRLVEKQSATVRTHACALSWTSPFKKNGRQTGEKLLKAEKPFKGWNQESYRTTEKDIIALPPRPNVTLWNPLTSSQLLEVNTSKNDASLTLCKVNVYCNSYITSLELKKTFFDFYAKKVT